MNQRSSTSDFQSNPLAQFNLAPISADSYISLHSWFASPKLATRQFWCRWPSWTKVWNRDPRNPTRTLTTIGFRHDGGLAIIRVVLRIWHQLFNFFTLGNFVDQLYHLGKQKSVSRHKYSVKSHQDHPGFRYPPSRVFLGGWMIEISKCNKKKTKWSSRTLKNRPFGKVGNFRPERELFGLWGDGRFLVNQNPSKSFDYL